MNQSKTPPPPPPALAKPPPPKQAEEPDPLPDEQALTEPERDLEPTKAGPEPSSLATPDEHADNLAGAAGETETPATDSRRPWWEAGAGEPAQTAPGDGAVETLDAGASLDSDDHAGDADDEPLVDDVDDDDDADDADDVILVDVSDDGDDNDDAQETGTVEDEAEPLGEPQTVVVPATAHEPARAADGGVRTPATGRGMPATVYRVLLVAPSDVAYERSVAEKAIGLWNSQHTEELGVALVARRWRAGENSRLWEQADLLVGVFGGMPGMRKSDASSSSTAAAVEEYLKSERGALFYFSACAANVTDESEGRRLRELRRACERRGLATEFSLPVQLKELLADDLTTQVQRLCGAARAA